ncbi:MAG: hypothetical protein R3B47_11155 [Bacteroidia bacterium]
MKRKTFVRNSAQKQLNPETSQCIRLTSQLEQVEEERARLDSENTLLNQRVASLEGEIRAGRIKMQHREAEIKEELKARTEQIEAQLLATRASQESSSPKQMVCAVLPRWLLYRPPSGA